MGLARVERDALEPQFLAHYARPTPCASGEGELHIADRLAGMHFVSQQRPLGQAPVVLRAHQDIHRPAQSVGALHEKEDIDLAVTNLHQSDRRQLGRSFGQAREAFEAARNFGDAAALAVGAACLACLNTSRRRVRPTAHSPG